MALALFLGKPHVHCISEGTDQVLQLLCDAAFGSILSACRPAASLRMPRTCLLWTRAKLGTYGASCPSRFWKGFLAVWIGGSIGQALAFLLARFAHCILPVMLYVCMSCYSRNFIMCCRFVCLLLFALRSLLAQSDNVTGMQICAHLHNGCLLDDSLICTAEQVLLACIWMVTCLCPGFVQATARMPMQLGCVLTGTCCATRWLAC